MCSWYEMLAIAFNLISGLSTSENDWILSLRYNLQRSIMLFYEAGIFSFSKNINSIGSLSWSPIYSTTVHCMWRKNIDNGGVLVRGEGEQVWETRRQIVMWMQQSRICIFAVLQERRFCVSNRIFRLLEVQKKRKAE